MLHTNCKEKSLVGLAMKNAFVRLPLPLLILLASVLFYPVSGAFGSPLAIAEATPNSVTLTWTAPGDDGASGTASQYDIRYASFPITEDNWNQATQATGEPLPQPAGSPETFEVTGLQPGTTYYFAVKTADEIPNWSTLSNVISKTTALEDVPPSAITDLITQYPSPTGISLRWTAPGDDGTSGTASAYDIRYSTATITDANWGSAMQVNGEPLPQAAGNMETFTINGLSQNTTYYFAIRTADEIPNWSALSNIAVGTTTSEPQLPEAPVLASPADGSTDLAVPVDLDWSSVATADLYQVQLDSLASFAGPLIDANTSQTDYSAAGLDSGASYYWRVRARNSVGWGGWSEIWDFTTACPLPSVPVLASPSDGATNVSIPVLLDWSDVAQANQYQLQVALSQSFSSPVIDVSRAGSSYNASTLQYDRTYYWHVRARNDCGWGSWSAICSFATRDVTVPTNITDFAAAPGPGHGEIELTWTATGDDGSTGTASVYDIRYSLVPLTAQNWGNASQVTGEPVPQPAGSAETFIVGDLDPDATLYFAIRVADEAGNWSALSNVTSASPTDAMPPATIMDLSAETGTEDGQMFLSWTATGDDGALGSASAYVVKYSQTFIDEGNWDSATAYPEVIPPLQAGTTQYMTMSGLEPGEEYYIAVKAYDECLNCSGLSNVVSCTAGTEFVLDIDDDEVETVSPPDRALLRTSRPLLSVRNVNTENDNNYFFEVAADSNFFEIVALSPPVNQTGGEITSWKTEESLPSNRTYYWRTKVNNGPYSPTLSFDVQARTHVYPNPFDVSVASNAVFTDIPAGSDFVLLSVSGTIVREWNNISESELSWDGTNESGNPVGAGTYLWFVENSDIKGKIVVIR
jgi:hypothetical protein